MRIADILKTNHQSILIVTPNRIEKQLLFDRFCYHKAVYVNPNLLKYNETFINVFTIDEINSNLSSSSSFVKNNICYIEFPESIPDQILAKLQMNSLNFVLTNELI